MEWLQTGFGLMGGFTGHIQNVTTKNFNGLAELRPSWSRVHVRGSRPHCCYAQGPSGLLVWAPSRTRRGSVVYNCRWPSPVKSFPGPNPAELMTIFYCLTLANAPTWRAGPHISLRTSVNPDIITGTEFALGLLLRLTELWWRLSIRGDNYKPPPPLSLSLYIYIYNCHGPHRKRVRLMCASSLPGKHVHMIHSSRLLHCRLFTHLLPMGLHVTVLTISLKRTSYSPKRMIRTAVLKNVASTKLQVDVHKAPFVLTASRVRLRMGQCQFFKPCRSSKGITNLGNPMICLPLCFTISAINVSQ
jgi:hypothetical protein